MTESQLTPHILLALCGTGEVNLDRNNIGMAWMRNGTPVRYGVGGPGGADFIGLHRGRYLAVEIKTPTGRQSPEQKLFQSRIERHGGLYRLVRGVDDAHALLAELRDLDSRSAP